MRQLHELRRSEAGGLLIPTPMAVTATTNDESLTSKGTFMGMRFQAYDTGGKPLSLRTARPDCASEACRQQTKVTYVIAHRYEKRCDSPASSPDGEDFLRHGTLLEAHRNDRFGLRTIALHL